MVSLSRAFEPAMLKGIKVYPDSPFHFEFILDQGDQKRIQPPDNLVKYFLASLTVPENDLWVNLSPYEKNRIVPQAFGQTAMGRDLLAEDYILKQITASLIYPQGRTGKLFWQKVYAQAREKFGTTDVSINTFNKVWIVPDKAVVYENLQAGTAYVVAAKLKVMLEEDYLAVSKRGHFEKSKVSPFCSQIIRDIVIPELTKEVNAGRNFAQLRQVYNSLILATWYKKKIRDGILQAVYADKNKIGGLRYSSRLKVGTIYQRYLQAFKKGTFNFIKEEIDPITQRPIPRKYFSGGVQLAWKNWQLSTTHQLSNEAMTSGQEKLLVEVNLNHIMDRAMQTTSQVWTAETLAESINNIVRNVPSSPAAVRLGLLMASLSPYDKKLLVLNVKVLSSYISRIQTGNVRNWEEYLTYFHNTIIRTVTTAKRIGALLNKNISFLDEFHPPRSINLTQGFTLSGRLGLAGVYLFGNYFEEAFYNPHRLAQPSLEESQRQKERLIEEYITKIFPLRNNEKALLRTLRARTTVDKAPGERTFKSDLRKKVSTTARIPVSNVLFVSRNDPLMRYIFLSLPRFEQFGSSAFYSALKDSQGRPLRLMALNADTDDVQLFVEAAHETSHALEDRGFSSKYGQEFYRVLSEGSQAHRETIILAQWMEDPAFNKRFGRELPSKADDIRQFVRVKLNQQGHVVFQLESQFFDALMQFIDDRHKGPAMDIFREFVDKGNEIPLINAVGPRRYDALRNFIGQTTGQFDIFTGDTRVGRLQYMDIQYNIANRLFLKYRPNTDFTRPIIKRAERLISIAAQTRLRIKESVAGNPRVGYKEYTPETKMALLSAFDGWLSGSLLDRQLEEMIMAIALTDRAMQAEKGQLQKNDYGGIDLNPANMDLRLKKGQGIQFHIDPATLMELQNLKGLVPVITDVRRISAMSLKQFLGI
jgi:hypothetical protein